MCFNETALTRYVSGFIYFVFLLFSLQLRSSYRTTLALIEPPIRTVALCGVSTGIFGFPLVPASEIALHEVSFRFCFFSYFNLFCFSDF